MHQYTWITWLFFFFFYSFFGWCFESAFVSIQQRKFVNRGFIRGPFLPLYGTGALMMLVVSMPFRDNLAMTYVAGCVGATVLEYVTGVTMEALFKVRYWDYSDQKFNFRGQICLSSTLAWGGLTILMTRVVHRPVEQLSFMLPGWAMTAVTMVTAFYFVADFALSFRAALDLRDVLVKMEQARQELLRMQKRLDVIIALSDEAKENRRRERELERAEKKEEMTEFLEGFAQKRDEIAASIEQKFLSIRDMVPSSEFLSEKKDELIELLSRFKLNQERQENKQFLSDFMKRSMLKGNPTMASKKFADALDDLKRSASEYRKKKKDEK